MKKYIFLILALNSYGIFTSCSNRFPKHRFITGWDNKAKQHINNKRIKPKNNKKQNQPTYNNNNKRTR